MADFCACCTFRLGVDPILNDLNREPKMDDSEIDFNFLVYNDLCEGCGHVVTVDQKGYPASLPYYYSYMEFFKGQPHYSANFRQYH